MFSVDNIKDLNDLELHIYKYIISHKQDIYCMRLKQIAELIHVSPSMITRVAQKLGYEGFVEWKTTMKMEESVGQHKKEDTLNYILSYFHSVDNEQFNQSISKAAKMIATSQEAIFFGVGISGAIAEAGASLFNRKGKRSVAYRDFSMRTRGMYNHNDCAIILTVSGETEEILVRMMGLKNLGVKMIVITNSASSTAAKLADLSFCYYMPSERNQDYYSSATQVPVIYILESLADALIEYDIE